MPFDSSSRANADDAVLARVRKLLAKAEDSAATPAEVEAFNTKAADLIARYGIDQAMLAADNPDLDVVGDRVVVLDAPYARDKAAMLGWVAGALGCRAVHRTRHPGGQKQLSVHLFGHRSNLERTELVFTSLLVQSAHALATVPVPPWENKAAFRRSWLQGFAVSVTRRLQAAERNAHSDAERQQTGDSRSLALVLADRSNEVDHAVQAAYPHLSKSRTRRLTGGGYTAGWSAGQRAELDTSRLSRRGAPAIGR